MIKLELSKEKQDIKEKNHEERVQKTLDWWKEKHNVNINKEVIGFIDKFYFLNLADNDKDGFELLRRQFRTGYCYYFAEILKLAFNRGEVCWAAPFGHIVWVDVDGIPYDVEGVHDGECKYYIPVTFPYVVDGMDDFKHVPGVSFNASEEYINNAITQYEKYLENQKEKTFFNKKKSKDDVFNKDFLFKRCDFLPDEDNPIWVKTKDNNMFLSQYKSGVFMDGFKSNCVLKDTDNVEYWKYAQY